jgi:hypothetical protein
MYECIRVKTRSSMFPDSLINEEGDLDNESEDSDFEREMLVSKGKGHVRPGSGSSGGSSSRLSIVARYGSGTPMSVD